MANSSYSNIHPVNEILRNLAIEAIPSDGQLIADQVIENVDVKDQIQYEIDCNRLTQSATEAKKNATNDSAARGGENYTAECRPTTCTKR